MVALAACSSDDHQLSSESVIRLTSEVTSMTRGTDLNQQSTQIVSGQNVGVIITGTKSVHNNVAWTVGDGGEMTNTGNPVYWDTGNATITAYHPYNKAWDETSVNQNFSVSVDQTAQGYINSDLLWTSKTAGKTYSPVPLTFAHKLAKINVTLTSDDLADLSDATINICGTNISTAFNPQSGELSASGTTTIRTIKAGVTTADANTATAIIVPQTVAADTRFIQVILGGNYYHYVLPSDKAFGSGHSYSYTLKLKLTTEELSCLSDNITDWNSDDLQEGDGDEAYLSLDVTQTTAGTLTTTLGGQMLSVTSLKVSGPLNGADVRCLRQMFRAPSSVSSDGVDSYFAESGVLLDLDLSDAYFMSGGNAYLTRGSNAYSTSSANIGTYMFYNTFAKSITLPGNTKTISSYAFFYSKYLTNVVIPESVTLIGSYAFQGCSSLQSITIPGNVASVQNGVFYDCSNLTEIICKPTTPPTGGSIMFYNIASDAKIYVPQGSVEAYKTANYWKDYADKIVGISE